ncbi:MAG TPA: MBOAT family protein [Rhizomicrobium sp.]|nr:MBOAT family protein [Rhizomicrobium sp.]
MLFNSFTFILLFLPTTLFGYVILGSWRRKWAAAWLVVASMTFYAYWDPRYLPLLLTSIFVNFLAGRILANFLPNKTVLRRLFFALSIGFNLALLGYFKYANFFVATFADATGFDFVIPKIILPLGVSFFTFTQIAFLVDVYRSEASEAKLLHYILFVTYFPHLIAGPILHHKEMMSQFEQPETYRFNSTNLVTGCVIFIIGLSKKVVLADGIAVYATPVFDAAAKGQRLLMPDAWGGALAYAFQLYFDFSGYCDMAIGASLLFGIALPLNFNSPYKSRSIIEFWQRWHMTLSRFLRDYLYIPLGGNRKGSGRQYLNLFITMLLGGLWHGAGWPFVIWGALHGFYLMINHTFRAMKKNVNLDFSHFIGSAASWILTFLAVVIGWVFFRAESLDAAVKILAGMANIAPCVAQDDCTASIATFHQSSHAPPVWMWVSLLFGIAVLAPNTQEIMRDHLHGIARPARSAYFLRMPMALQTSRSWAMAVGTILALGLGCLSQSTNFLYFNF